LAEATIDLLKRRSNDPEGFAGAARRRIEENYAIELVARRYQNLYLELMGLSPLL